MTYCIRTDTLCQRHCEQRALTLRNEWHGKSQNPRLEQTLPERSSDRIFDWPPRSRRCILNSPDSSSSKLLESMPRAGRHRICGHRNRCLGIPGCPPEIYRFPRRDSCTASRRERHPPQLRRQRARIRGADGGRPTQRISPLQRPPKLPRQLLPRATKGAYSWVARRASQGRQQHARARHQSLLIRSICAAIVAAALFCRGGRERRGGATNISHIS